jgi:isochorismate hydrolase
MIKKEKYFDDIQNQAESLISEIGNNVDIHSFELKPAKAALLVLDMQGFFLEPDSHAFIPAARAILPNILKLQNLFLENNSPVFQTRHLNTVENAGRMGKWWSELMTADHPLSQITAVLRDRRTVQLEKNQYDAFYHTDLLSLLRDRGVIQLVITGVMAHLCCETTARSAFVRGFEVIFVVDGTATYNRNFHMATLLNLSHGFAVPGLSYDIMDAFQK